jgi:serine/threonine-protein kinase
VILFQLLTGTKPFIATELPELMRKVINETPPSVLTFRPELWPGLDRVVQLALARNPEDRLPTAEAFIDALNVAIEERPSDDAPPLDLSELSNTPKDQAAPVKERLNQTIAEKLSPSTIESLGRSLARWLGPIAPLVVKNASREATDIDMLLDSLALQIHAQEEASSFRRAAEQALRDDLGFASAQMEVIISQAEIRAAAEALLPLIGPIAPKLVAREAEKAVGREDFYRRISDFITNDKDRATFMSFRAKMPRDH